MSQLTKVLSDIAKGKVLGEADERLAQLIAAIREHGGAGTLQLTLKIRSISDGTVQVEGASAVKLPTFIQPASIFFTTEENTLSRSNPAQGELPLRAIEGGAPAVNNQKAEASA
jgi:hypothetical protein